MEAMRLSKLVPAVLAAVLCSRVASAQIPGNLMMAQEPIQVSDHVFMLKGFPNVGIIVGERATLVVDTGLGNANGQIVANVAKKLAKGSMLYLTTTHYHPEHAGGEGGFPPTTVIVRNQVQQLEVTDHGMEMIQMFARRPEMKDLLADAKLRDPDIVYDKALMLDLGGGVKARLFWMGAAHTMGDEMIFVEPDQVLVSGDIVQSKQAASAGFAGASVKNWITILDQLGGLRAKIVLPDHSDPGEASKMIADQRHFLADLQSMALDAKHNGVSADDAAKQVTDKLKEAYPDYEAWYGVPATVKKVYEEYP